MIEPYDLINTKWIAEHIEETTGVFIELNIIPRIMRSRRITEYKTINPAGFRKATLLYSKKEVIEILKKYPYVKGNKKKFFYESKNPGRYRRQNFKKEGVETSVKIRRKWDCGNYSACLADAALGSGSISKILCEGLKECPDYVKEVR